MKKAVIQTVVSTYKNGGTFRNNIVELEIPMEAAEIILKAWSDWDGDFEPRKSIRSKFLSSNQTAEANLIIDGEVKGGMRFMSKVDTFVDE